MGNQKYSSAQSPELAELIAVYADVWADVIIGKNLDAHLREIEEDLVYINKIVDLKEASKQDAISIYRISNQLYRLKDIILRKQQK